MVGACQGRQQRVSRPGVANIVKINALGMDCFRYGKKRWFMIPPWQESVYHVTRKGVHENSLWWYHAQDDAFGCAGWAESADAFARSPGAVRCAGDPAHMTLTLADRQPLLLLASPLVSCACSTAAGSLHLTADTKA